VLEMKSGYEWDDLLVLKTVELLSKVTMKELK